MKYFCLILTIFILYTSAIHTAEPRGSVRRMPPIQQQLTTDALRAAFDGSIQEWEPIAIQGAFEQGPNAFGLSILHAARDERTAQTICDALYPDQVITLLTHRNRRGHNVLHQHCRHDCPDLLHYLLSKANQFGVAEQLLTERDWPHGDTPAHKAAAAQQYRSIKVLSYWDANFQTYNKDSRGPETPTMIAARLNWLSEYQKAHTAGWIKKIEKLKKAREEEERLNERYTPERLKAILTALQTETTNEMNGLG